MIGIIDVGNAKSVENALEKLGYSSVRTIDSTIISKCNGIILPGVGEFGTVMQQIDPLSPLIKRWKKPFLGICAGMQVLFESSEESPSVEGLGIIKGKVKKFQNIRTPQIGWNKLENSTNPLLGKEEYVYFVNSYYCVPREKAITSTAKYGINFAASINKENYYGVQFHPEKSGECGLEMLNKFARLVVC